jgi:ubiquinone/menaquinone biosynthesis C-methylase UbiE
MSANYKNWVPNGMITALGAGTAILGAGTAALMCAKITPNVKKVLVGTAGTGTLVCGPMAAWSVYAHGKFSYDGKRQLSKEIVEGTAEYITLPEGGIGLDVGCGSGALTIACAKRNPNARMVGIDRWGPEYASFSKQLCEQNAEAEGVSNVRFEKGDACRLDFADETFDAVTSNYVYHNISRHNKQELLKETLRVLKKGGTFAIHDLMSKARYGDMEQFAQELRNEGYEEVNLIRTDRGMFMSKGEAEIMLLKGSTLLTGRK